MIGLLLILTWLSQGIPVPQAQTGSVTGTLKTEAGTPAVGIRIGALVKPESSVDVTAGSALASIAETDASGRFRLENIPQGRYYIIAGRVDFPTYFPGTQDVTAGRIVLVKPGDILSGIDFVMNAGAVRPPDTSFGNITIAPAFSLPVSIRMEDGGPAPAYSPAGFTSLRLIRTTDGQVMDLPMSTSNLTLPIPPAGTLAEFRVSIENLPASYAVSRMQYGPTPITNNILKLSTIAAPASGTSYPSAVPAAGLVLSITLAAVPNSARNMSGVRITGRAPTSEMRSIYLSGTPGVFFADGTFEFRGVQPGRYTVSTPDNPGLSHPLAAAVAVGSQDVAGIELTSTVLLPLDIRTPRPPDPIGSRAPGSIPLAGLKGLIVDEMTHEPIATGIAYLSGHYGGSVFLADGRFEFAKLLPGSYQLEVQGFGYDSVRKTIVIGEEDVKLELSILAAEVPVKP